jgi:glycosyltransferase involved in cell wall biosynthesis
VAPLRIVFFGVYGHAAGTYFRYHHLAMVLSRLGHDVLVSASDLDHRAKSRREWRDGVCYEIVPRIRGARFFGGGNNPLAALRRGFRRRQDADVVHSFQPFLESVVPWWRAAGRARLCCADWDDLWTGGLFTGPVSSFEQFWSRASVNRLERLLPRRAGLMTTCSDFLADLARDRGAEAVAVLPNGFRNEKPMPRCEARLALGLEPTAVYVGFMGRTIAELSWCLEAFARQAPRHPRLRLALCGMDAAALAAMPDAARARTDHLGQLSAADASRFAAAIDLGLMPLEDSAFNRSRFPIKFADTLGAGTPILASAVGDCARHYGSIPGVLLAGRSRAEWDEAFTGAVAQAVAGALPRVDAAAVGARLGWDSIGLRLEGIYRDALAGRVPEAR